jgi:hypothetical protein
LKNDSKKNNLPEFEKLSQTEALQGKNQIKENYRYLGWTPAPNWQGGHRQHDAGLVLVLMPGRSLVERSASQSAQFQEYLRARLVENSQQLDIEVAGSGIVS